MPVTSDVAGTQQVAEMVGAHMSFLMNAWYVAAWAEELRPDAIVARRILDQPIALFRRSDGRPAAILDRCPHRFAPLSAGRIKDDAIACGYHGLAFDGDGRCVANPHGPVLRNAAITAWPVHDAHRATWIWMGDRERADPALIPDLSYLGDAPDTAFSAGQLLSGAGQYELFVDNVMDLSHTDFLHPTTLGGGAITSARQKIEETPDHIDVTWYSPDTPPSPLLRELFDDLPASTDFFQKVRWYAPSVMRLIAATVEAGQPEETALANINAHILTPETSSSTHYFFAATRNYRVDDHALNERIATTRARIFATEDKPMIESVQARMGDAEFWSLKPLLLSIDAASVRVRRRLKALIEREAAGR